jgi:hypothetical protein
MTLMTAIAKNISTPVPRPIIQNHREHVLNQIIEPYEVRIAG